MKEKNEYIIWYIYVFLLNSSTNYLVNGFRLVIKLIKLEGLSYGSVIIKCFYTVSENWINFYEFKQFVIVSNKKITLTLNVLRFLKKKKFFQSFLIRKTKHKTLFINTELNVRNGDIVNVFSNWNITFYWLWRCITNTEIIQ